MTLRHKREFQWNYLALAFAIPSVGMLFVMLISGYEPFGKYSMLYSDMYHQYYPFFVEFRRALREGKGLIYTWSVGMGMDYLSLIAYYLASPVNFLSVLVPESWLLEFFSLLMPLKLGLAGLFFAVFLKRLFGRNDISIAVFGGFYGLCAWALGYQWNIMWLDSFALLPLVALGTVSLLREKRFLLYTVTLFLSVYSNYYIGLFTCIFVFLLFFVYQFCRWGGWGKFFRDLFRIAFFSVIAIGMTAILTLPAFMGLQTTQSSVNKFPDSFRLNIAKTHDLPGLLDAMRQVAGNMGGCIEPSFKEGLPNVYCGIFSITLMFLYLISNRIPLRDKLCGVGLLLFFNVSFIIRQLDYIWHGFHFTNMIPYRFSFLYSFVVLYMGYRAWLIRETFRPMQIVAAGLMTSGILCFSEEMGKTVPVKLLGAELEIPLYVIYNSVYLVLYLLSFLYGTMPVQVPEVPENSELQSQLEQMEELERLEWMEQLKQRQLESAKAERMQLRRSSAALLLLVMCMELVGNLISFGMHFTGTGVSNYPKGTTYTASVIRYMHERERKNLFFRAETTHSQTLNDGAINGYNGVTAFTSSANVKTTEFIQGLGFSAKNTYNRYLFEESSPVSNLFLGLKYMIDRDGKDKTSTYFKEANHFGDTTLLENTAYLPLGFLAQSELAEVVMDSSQNAFVFQNKLFTAATGVQEEVWHRIPGTNLTITPNGTTLSESNESGYCRYSAPENKTDVTYTYVADQEGFLCIHLNLPKRNDYYISVNGVERFKETISLPQMMAVGDVMAGDVIDIRIVCDAGESSTMTLSAAILDGERFRRGYDILNNATLALTSFEGTYVAGTILCDRDGLLYTSIPQNGNWSAKVDGKPAQIKLVGDCMVALDLAEGAHRVEFTYRNEAFAIGWKISLICSLILLAAVQLCYQPDWKNFLHQNRKKGKYQK